MRRRNDGLRIGVFLFGHVNTEGVTVPVVFAIIIDGDKYLVIPSQGKLCLIKLAPSSHHIAKITGTAKGYPPRRAGR
jgi:hypothetical protein